MEEPKRLTRLQTSIRMQLSITWLRRLEAQGKLTAHLDSEGTAFYYTEQVDKLIEERKLNPPVRGRPSGTTLRGRMSAEVFRLIAAKKTLREIVLETEYPPDIVRKLWKEYHTPFGQDEKERAERLAANKEERAARQIAWREHQEKLARIAAEAVKAPERRAFDRVPPVPPLPGRRD